MKGKTVVDAAADWVNGFNAVQYGMIKALMKAAPDSWSELTTPNYGDRVYVYNLPEEKPDGQPYESTESYGEIAEYLGNETYRIEMDDGESILVKEDDFDVERDSTRPMWGWLWSFGNSSDDYWLEELDGIRLMSQCGFRIYKHDEWGYFFGIDGAGYSFMEEHWEPLYRVRGLQWHDERAEHERQMLKKGYTKGKLGGKRVWLDKDNNVVEEVK